MNVQSILAALRTCISEETPVQEWPAELVEAFFSITPELSDAIWDLSQEEGIQMQYTMGGDDHVITYRLRSGEIRLIRFGFREDPEDSNMMIPDPRQSDIPESDILPRFWTTSAPASVRRTAEGPQVVVQTFEGPVIAPGAVFGIRNGMRPVDGGTVFGIDNSY